MGVATEVAAVTEVVAVTGVEAVAAESGTVRIRSAE